MTSSSSGLSPLNLSPGSPAEAPSEEPPRQSRVPRLGLLLLGLLALMAGLGMFLWLEISAVRGRLADVERRMVEGAAAAEGARQRAEAAERAALEAARGRDQAMTEADAAQADAETAREESRVAQESAKASEEQARAAQEAARLAREEADRIRRDAEAELQRLQQALGQIAETRKTALGLVMNLGSDRLKFDFNKATLRPENRELLSRIAGVLLTSKDYHINVLGHTDDVGSVAYNQELSERRAQAVRDYLVEAGIDSEVVTTQGLGKSQPLVPGTSEAARAKNRRVELGIVSTRIEYLREPNPFRR